MPEDAPITIAFSIFTFGILGSPQETMELRGVIRAVQRRKHARWIVCGQKISCRTGSYRTNI